MNLKIALVSTALALGVAGCMTPMASAPPAAVTTATAFVPMATSSNLFEIESSRLALERSRNPRIRSYANMMVRDHSMTTQALMGGMQMAAMGGMAPALDTRRAAMLNQLASASGRQFDALYAQMQVMAHQEALALHGGYAQAGSDPALRNFAASVTPHIQHHLAQARRLARLVVVDAAFCLERDEEISFDTAAPRRNGATLAALELADVVVAVCAADAIGVQRFVRGLAELRELVPGARVRVVVNRVRRGPVGPRPERQLADALERYAGVRDCVLVPEDRAALDSALLTGRTLAEAAPGSQAREALRGLAVALVGELCGIAPQPSRVRGRRRLRAG